MTDQATTAVENGSGALCVIPARGGSKRIPRKNARRFAGTPLIARTVATVLASGVVERVVVSTDDPEIAAIAKAAGAEVPFLRSPDLADDHTPTIPVVADAINRLAALDERRYETTWVVYPTAVLLEPGDLVDADRMFKASAAPVAMSVVESRGAVERAWRDDGTGRGRMVDPSHANTRTQDLPPAFFDAGQFYVATTAFWCAETTLADVEPLLLALPAWRAVDIDTEDDWRLAEALFGAQSRDPERQRLEALWAGDFGDRYIERNRDAGADRGDFWQEIVHITDPASVLEIGCNVGANLQWLADGSRRIVGVDVNQTALDALVEAVPGVEAVRAPASSLPFAVGEFDVVFTAGVLIHQPDAALDDVLSEMRRCSRRWVLMAEYFAPTTEEVPYRGVEGALFRRDYGALLERQSDDFVLRRSGFLGRDAGWDDVTWWLFERR